MVRSMLRGEKSDFDLITLSSHGYRQAPMENPPPIYIAALRPKMIEMAAEIGDGVIYNLWPKGALPRMMEHIRIGAERAGKDPADVEIVNRGDAPANLEGWSLTDIDDGSPTFVFPFGSVAPGGVVRVYTNEAHPEWGGYSFERGSAIWNNGEPDTAGLIDPAGALVSTSTYPPGC